MTRDELHDAELREIAQRLGTKVAGRLDVEATAQAVVGRLRQAPVVVRPVWRRPAWLSIAAAVVLLLGTRVALRTWHREQPPAPVVDVDGLSADQLRQVLNTFDQATDDASGSADTGLDELTAPELRRLLHSLEG